jgi:3-hydroxybutyryl-CoA dehydratase
MNGKSYFFEDLSVGMQSDCSHQVTREDIQAFADVSGDNNPLHLDEAYAAETVFKGCIAHGMLSAAYISKLLGTQLPGPGCIYLSQSLKFRAPVRPGETVDTQVEVTALDERRRKVTLVCTCKVAGTVVVDGEATMMVPSREAQ